MKKRIFILFGIGFISFSGFADSSTRNGNREGKGDALMVMWKGARINARAHWKSRLKSNIWKERRNAVRDWATAVHSYPQEIFPDLELKLSDGSQKVREAAVTALKDMAVEFPFLTPEIVKALADQQPNDNESIFLQKIKTSEEMIKSINLFTELDISGVDQVYTALYDVVETGISNEKNIPVSLAALQLLDAAVDRLVNEVSNGLLFTEKISDHVMRGLEIATQRFGDRSPEVRSSVSKLLRKVLQKRNLFADFQVSQIVSLVEGKGFSNPNFEIKESAIDFLMGIVEIYPSLNFEVTTLLTNRQAKENSHYMKTAIGEVVKQLSDRNGQGPNLLLERNRNAGCHASLQGSQGVTQTE